MAEQKKKNMPRANEPLRFFKKIDEVLKVRYLGIGFVWAWVYCSFETSAIYPNRQGIGINADPSWLISATVVALALIASSIIFRNKDLSHIRWMHYCAPTLAVLGTVLSALTDTFPLAYDVARIVSGLMTGTGTAWLILLWADVLSRLDKEVVEAVVPGASFIMLLSTLVFPYLNGVVGIIAVASLPLISGVLLLLCYSEEKDGDLRLPQVSKIERSTILVLVRVSLVLCVSYFIIGCLGAMSTTEGIVQEASGFDIPTFIGSAFGIVLAICFVFFSIKIDFDSLFRWLAPLMILALALFPWQVLIPELVTKTILAITDIALQIITFIYFIDLAKRSKITAVLGIGISQGFIQVGVLIGNVFGGWAGELVSSGVLNVFILVLGLICLLAFSTILIPQSQTLKMKEEPHVIDSESLQLESLPQASLAQIASKYKLSGRETEVFEYLAKGRSQPYIREVLYLSRNTVSSHVKSIYRKLGIHSRQELLDLIERS